MYGDASRARRIHEGASALVHRALKCLEGDGELVVQPGVPGDSWATSGEEVGQYRQSAPSREREPRRLYRQLCTCFSPSSSSSTPQDFHGRRLRPQGKGKLRVGLQFDLRAQCLGQRACLYQDQRLQVFEEVHGPEADPSQHDLDPKVVMRARGGRKHGRFVFGNGNIDPATAPNLPHLKATATSSSASIRSRPVANSSRRRRWRV